MADGVRVQFSASIGALISGVEEAKRAIENVRESVDSLAEGARGLLEAFGLAFSAEKYRPVRRAHGRARAAMPRMRPRSAARSAANTVATPFAAPARTSMTPESVPLSLMALLSHCTKSVNDRTTPSIAGSRAAKIVLPRPSKAHAQERDALMRLGEGRAPGCRLARRRCGRSPP